MTDDQDQVTISKYDLKGLLRWLVAYNSETFKTPLVKRGLAIVNDPVFEDFIYLISREGEERASEKFKRAGLI